MEKKCMLEIKGKNALVGEDAIGKRHEVGEKIALDSEDSKEMKMLTARTQLRKKRYARDKGTKKT